MRKNEHEGSSFDDFLRDEGIFEECTAMAIKRVLAWQLEQYMQEHHLKKTEFARLLDTSRSQLDRLLDKHSTALNLNTLSKAASIMGKRVEISLV
jgi:predicted XRE-type DNA-binding protein